MKVIQTSFGGYRFRSRTEARWAVFFQTAGIRFEYEKEGFVFSGTPYLPDFWLPEMRLWLEVKGSEPISEERQLCEMLAAESQCGVMLAVGPPQPQEQISWFPPSPLPDDPLGGERYFLADDRRNEGEFWLVSEGGSAFSIGPVNGLAHERYALVHTSTKAAYQAAKSARFEHGEGGGG